MSILSGESTTLVEVQRAETFRRFLQDRGVKRTLIIGSQFRSGSTLMGSLLQNQGGLCFDKELFNLVPTWERKPVSEVIREWERIASMAVDGCLGFRLMWSHGCALTNFFQLENPQTQGFSQLFPGARWLFMRRADKIAQAVSFFIASYSCQWQSPQGTHLDTVPLQYSFEVLNRLYHLLLSDDFLWMDFRKHHESQGPIITYEEMSAACETALHEALSAFGLDFHASKFPEQLPLNKQIHPQSLELCRRFASDLHRYCPLEFLPTRLIGRPTPGLAE